MNRKLVWKVTACGLAGVLTLGAFSFEAIATPSAGISSYTLSHHRQFRPQDFHWH